MNWQSVQMQSGMMSSWSCQIDWAKTASAHADSPGPWRTAQALTLAIDGPPLYLACRRGAGSNVFSYPHFSSLPYTHTYVPRYALVCMQAIVTKSFRAHLPSGEPRFPIEHLTLTR